ncbi:MAG: hydroxyacylglutathione hydrolase [Planctomycetota bacterium]|jgi:hydroxyacylglutathione hydrolase
MRLVPIALAFASSLAAQGSCATASVNPLGTPCGPASLTATLPSLGSTMNVTIDGTVAGLAGSLFQSPGPGVQTPFLGCDIYLTQLNVAALVLTDANGDATVPVAIPNNPALCGAQLIVQGAVWSGTGSVLGMDVTNALELNLGSAPPTGGTFPPDWIHGSSNCSTNTDPPIQVHQYAARTWILRQNACLNFEAPFMYLMIGDTKAILIDSGATSSASLFPIRATVQGILDTYEAANSLPDLDLIVAHSHSHGDHRQGDGQFIGQPNTTVVGSSLNSVQSFYGFTSWPTQQVTYDLGGRSLDVLGIPGHHSTHIAFYDAETGALFTGDSLYPGYLFIPSLNTYKASIARLTAFAQTKVVTNVLGGHVEMRSTPGVWYPYGTVYQPLERDLQLDMSHLIELNTALLSINGPVTQVHNDFIINAF